MLSAAAYQKLTEHLARRAASDEICRAFQVSDKDELQDLLAALVLSECVYKKVEMAPEQLAATVASFLADFPPDLVHLEALQLSRTDVTQNYLVAVGSRAVYVAFMGTKQARDISTDLAFAHQAVWVAAEQQEAGARAEVPSAHRGFLSRAKAVPIEQLQQLAVSSGRRLVLCGHSLGGAVAKLAGLRLLRSCPTFAPPDLRVICFATPAVGNNALARLVEAAGWGGFFKTYVLPEDQLMRVLRLTQATPPAATAATAAAAAAAAADAAAPAAGGGSSVQGPLGGVLQPLAARVPLAKPVRTVVDLLQQPLARESAAQQLRQELMAEEAEALDTASMDVADAGAPLMAAPPAAEPAAHAAAAGSSSSRVPQLLRSISRRFLPTAAQQDGVPPSAGPAAGSSDARATPLAASPEPAGAAASSAWKATNTPQAPAAALGQAAGAGATSSSRDGGPADEPAVGSAAGTQAISATSNTSSLQARQQSMGVVLELQRRWLGYQLQQLGRAALSPLTSARQAVSVFYPFGLYRFITAGGVLPPDAPLPSPSDPPSAQAAAFAEANPGVLCFHRMVAYRSRCVYVVASIAASLASQGLLLPPSFAAVAAFTATHALDVAGAPPAAGVDAAGSSGGTGPPAGPGGAGAPAPPVIRPLPPRVRLGGVVPPLRVACASSRPPLRPPPLLLPAADAALAGGSVAGNGSGSSRAGSPAAEQGSRGEQQQQPPARRAGPLSFLQAARGASRGGAEPTVPLRITLAGSNLHLARQLRVTALGQQYGAGHLALSRPGGDLGGGGASAGAAGAASAAGLAATSSSGDPADGSDSPAVQRSSSSSSGTTMARSVLGRLQQLAVAASKAWEGERPRWRAPADSPTTASVTVLLPLSVIDQLTAKAVQQQAQAAASAAGWQQQHRGRAASPPSRPVSSSSNSSYRRMRSSPVGLLTGAGAAAPLGDRPASRASQHGFAGDAGNPVLEHHHHHHPLVLHLRSDWEELSVPISVQPYTVGIVGSSSRAALLLQLLLGNSARLQQHFLSRSAAAAAAAAAGANAAGGGFSSLQRWLPQSARQLAHTSSALPQQDQQQQQQLQLAPPVAKLKAVATVTAAAGAAVAAARLSTLSKQLVGRSQPAAATTAAASAAAPAAASATGVLGSGGRQRSTWRSPTLPASSAAGLGASGSRASLPAGGDGWVAAASSPHQAGAAASTGDAAAGAAGELVDGSTMASSRSGAAGGAGSGGSGGGAGVRAGGLHGVLYTTLPPARAFPLPGLPNTRGDDGGQQRTLSQVLRRATKQLQLQQQAAARWAVTAGLGGNDGGGLAGLRAWLSQLSQGLVPPQLLSTPAAAGAALGRAQQALRGSWRTSDAAAGAAAATRPNVSGGSSSRAGASKAVRAGRGGAGRSTPRPGRQPTAGSGDKTGSPQPRAKPTSGSQAVAASSAAMPGGITPPQLKLQRQQPQGWDVLVLVVRFDLDLVSLLKHRSALGKLAAAAEAAGVAVVPVLLVEGREACLSVSLTDMRAIGLPLHAGSSSSSSMAYASGHAEQQHGGRSSSAGHLQAVLQVDAAAGQLASALQVPSVPVFRLPVQGLLAAGLLPLAEGERGGAGGTLGGLLAGRLLSMVGGLDAQYQLLQAIQLLEGHLAGVMQHQQPQPPPPLAPLLRARL